MTSKSNKSRFGDKDKHNAAVVSSIRLYSLCRHQTQQLECEIRIGVLLQSRRRLLYCSCISVGD